MSCFFLSSCLDHAQQLLFEDEFPLLVLLAALVRLVVFPPDYLLALPA